MHQVLRPSRRARRSLVSLALLATLFVLAPAATTAAQPPPVGGCAEVNPVVPVHQIQHRLQDEFLPDTTGGMLSFDAPAENSVLDVSLGGQSVSHDGVIADLPTGGLSGFFQVGAVSDSYIPDNTPPFANYALGRYRAFVEVTGQGASIDFESTAAAADGFGPAEHTNFVQLIIRETTDDGVNPLPGGLYKRYVKLDGDTIAGTVALPPGTYKIVMTVVSHLFSDTTVTDGGSSLTSTIRQTNWSLECAPPKCASILAKQPRHHTWYRLKNTREGTITTKNVPVAWDTVIDLEDDESGQEISNDAAIVTATASSGGDTLQGQFRLATVSALNASTGDAGFTAFANGKYRFFVDVSGEDATFSVSSLAVVDTRNAAGAIEAKTAVNLYIRETDDRGRLIAGGFRKTYTPGHGLNIEESLDLEPGFYQVLIDIRPTVSGPEQPSGGQGLASAVRKTTWDFDCG